MSSSKKSAAPVKITALQVENVKRVTAVSMDCTGDSLTVIGGRNGQGKTSVLDAIMWALGGDRFRPTRPVKDGAEEAYVKVSLDNGVTVERKGVSGSLKVSSATGKGGQALLNEFVNLFALNLPKFMGASGTEKAKMLLDAMPAEFGARLQKLTEQIKELYDERHAMGQVADRKQKYAAELPYDESVPEQPLSGAEMANRMRDALAVNSRNANLRGQVGRADEAVKSAMYRLDSTAKRVADIEAALAEAREDNKRAKMILDEAELAAATARKTAAQLKDEDTTAIEKELENIDAMNARIRANQEKRHAESEAEDLRIQYNDLTAQIDKIRSERMKLLADVKLPLDGLSLDEEGDLIYRDQKWDCMSGAEQLQVATAISSAMKPECGFVLLDRLEAMDTETLREFGEWLQEQNLQAIGTRVGTGDECSIVIEDGVALEDAPAAPKGKKPYKF